jgi:hypothetical protein
MAFATLFVGCAGGQEKDDAEPTGPTVPSYFEEIPSSTIFFVGGTEPVPEEFTRATLEYMEGATAATGNPGAQAEFLRSELGGSYSLDGLSNIGLSSTPRFAFYSYGFIPMLRFTLADATKFQGFVERYSQQYGLEPEERSHDGKKYFVLEGREEHAIYRFSKTEFVMAFVNDQQIEAFVPHFFGTKKPEASLAGENEFLTFTERYGFERSIGGYFDVLKWAGVASGNIQMEGDAANFVDNGPLQPQLAGRMDAETCKAELARIAAWTPRLVMGFREYSDESVDMGFGVVLDPELAQEMKKARGEVPGYGSSLMDNALASVGFGLDMAGMIEAGSAWGRRVQQEPFQCRGFKDLNIYAQQIIGAGGQAPAAVSGIQGFSALLDGVRIKYNQTHGTHYQPSVATALRSQDPQTLMMFASQVAPMLQSLQLKADGEPVMVEQLDAAYPGIVESTALMTNEFIGVAMGPGMADKLSTMLQGEKDEQPPFFVAEARTGEAVSTMVADLRSIIDGAEKNMQARNVTQEDITLARKYVDRIEGIFPDGEQIFEVSMTLDEDTVFMNYADSGPDLEEGWLAEFDAESQEEARALMKVLGLNRRGGPPVMRERRRPSDTAVEAVPTEEAPEREASPESEEGPSSEGENSD